MKRAAATPQLMIESAILVHIGAWGCGNQAQSQAPLARDAEVRAEAQFGAEVSNTNLGPGHGDGADDVSRAGACPEQTVPQRTVGARVDVQVEFALSDHQLRVGEPNIVAGGTIIPLDLRFYVSGVGLRTYDGRALPLDLLTDTGATEKYGVHLVIADDPASQELHWRAPAGRYAGVVFTLGLSDACNAGAVDRPPPLGTASQMTWPHTGYLSLRYQAAPAVQNRGGESGLTGPRDASATTDPGMFAHAAVDASAPGGSLPMVVHMGGQIGELFAPVVVASGDFTVPAFGQIALRLRLNVDEMLRGAATPADLSGFVGPPGEEVLAGERLRRAAPHLSLFQVMPP